MLRMTENDFVCDFIQVNSRHCLYNILMTNAKYT